VFKKAKDPGLAFYKIVSPTVSEATHACLSPMFAITRWQMVLHMYADLLELEVDDSLERASIMLLGDGRLVTRSLQNGGALALAPFLRVNQTVTELNMTGAELDSDGFRTIIDALVSNEGSVVGTLCLQDAILIPTEAAGNSPVDLC
jgi:hypothetical protein